VNKTSGYEEVDDRKWVRNQTINVVSCGLTYVHMPKSEIILEKEVVCITWRGSKHNNGRHDIVLKQARGRRVEGPVASPDLGEGQHAFTAELLDD
jgi:hypothetical protein